MGVMACVKKEHGAVRKPIKSCTANAAFIKGCLVGRLVDWHNKLAYKTCLHTRATKQIGFIPDAKLAMLLLCNGVNTG